MLAAAFTFGGDNADMRWRIQSFTMAGANTFVFIGARTVPSATIRCHARPRSSFVLPVAFGTPQ
ncbi:MAG TPA: hypothetical protein VFG12_14955 [Rhodopila sp.]|jgi:hypothetical protein|nr:hypothetical protein [Rhodopila sp.]